MNDEPDPCAMPGPIKINPPTGAWFIDHSEGRNVWMSPSSHRSKSLIVFSILRWLFMAFSAFFVVFGIFAHTSVETFAREAEGIGFAAMSLGLTNHIEIRRNRR